MKFNYFSILAAFMLLFTSCSDELETENIQEKAQAVNYDEIQVLNGRLYFPNKSIFQSYYAELREKNENDLAELLQRKFYSKDFYSLKPIVNEQTEEVEVSRHLAKIKSKSNKNGLQQKTSSTNEDLLENFDDLEDIFGEDVFTSFLNQDAELQVKDKVYKYTDTGLFIADAKEVKSLNTYLEKKQISKNLLEPTPEATKLAYIEENNPCGGLQQVQNFEYFIAEVDNAPCSGGGSTGGGSSGGSSGSGSSSSSGTPNAQLAIISNGLDQCSGAKPWLGNLFGTTKVCIDQYESKKRVKIKYYNIDIFLGYVIGIKTKHQKKGWTGLWRKQDTDEVALGVNSLTWKFTHPTPAAALLNYQPARIYLHNGKMFETVNGYYNSVFAGNIPVPNLPFANKVDFIIEVAIGAPLSPFNDEEDVREFIYEQLFNTAKGLLQSHSNRQLKKMGVVVTTQTSTWVQFYDFSESCTNCDKRENIIDFGIVTPQITYNFGTGSGGSFSISSWNFNFNNPSLTGMSAFGMAKRNGQWHGKRMVF
ncbi:hypothetical protein [Polaribacter butkevichii]|uniref:Uncharacterized protein n=1 Tax=Polaribacter butkevichii TaxID=218490 RepID=A0A2P6C725_9FLAO|nr:hypothetical protein [Polaribacter butkevichii]PQJ68720.1 hypothetical protein BTO14_11745 [Polaribacter butkevichii]